MWIHKARKASARREYINVQGQEYSVAIYWLVYKKMGKLVILLDTVMGDASAPTVNGNLAEISLMFHQISRMASLSVAPFATQSRVIICTRESIDIVMNFQDYLILFIVFSI